MAKALISRLSSELRYRKNKNTLAGLLVFAERAGKGRKLGRLAAESPGEYLRRLAAQGTKEDRDKKNDALLSLADRFNNFINQIFDLSAIVYYITFSAVFVFLSAQAVQKRRWS